MGSGHSRGSSLAGKARAALGYLRRGDLRALATRTWARLQRSPSPNASAFPFALHLEPPTEDERSEHSALMRGWVAVPAGAEVDGPFLQCGARVPVARRQRPDGERLFPHQQIVGFDDYVPLPGAPDFDVWSLEVVVDGSTYRTPVPVSISSARHEEFRAKKRRTLERIAPLLRCPGPTTHDPESPSCGGRVERVSRHELRCSSCSRRYGGGESSFDFLPETSARAVEIEATENVSSWGYDDWAADIIEANRDGLVLDNGSGLKREYHENIVHLDIVEYPSTDVLGIGERLPLADESFDAVFSLAVLEHVRDPFRCAAEITRVLRPGGRLYCCVPFLQPYHGYPHHYYNMTLQGLENLFRGRLEIEHSGTPIYGWPIFSLPWMLRSYRDGLPPGLARRFGRMRVDELLGDPMQYLEEPFVTELGERPRTDLASANYVMATKPQRATVPTLSTPT